MEAIAALRKSISERLTAIRDKEAERGLAAQQTSEAKMELKALRQVSDVDYLREPLHTTTRHTHSHKCREKRDAGGPSGPSRPGLTPSQIEGLGGLAPQRGLAPWVGRAWLGGA